MSDNSYSTVKQCPYCGAHNKPITKLYNPERWKYQYYDCEKFYYFNLSQQTIKKEP